MYDLVIIGAGAAGLSAAIYGARAGLDFLVLEQDGWGGGQIVSAHRVQNYPGFPDIKGEELGERMRNHAEQLGVRICPGQAEEIDLIPGGMRIWLAEGEPIEAKTVIAATGAVPRRLGIPGEGEFIGAGVSYCALCDGAFYAGKAVLVVGGGDTAVEDALYLSGMCGQVTVLLRRDEFRGAKTRVDLLKRQANIQIYPNTVLRELTGDGRVQAARISREGREETIRIDGVFIAVGSEPTADYLKSLPLSLDNGYILADESGATAIPGLFAAGDIRGKKLRQVLTAAADGANAAASAAEYLRPLRE